MAYTYEYRPYCSMRTDRQVALRLRLNGKSYSDIGKILGVPKSTLSDWFSSLVISQEAREKIEKKARKNSLEGLLRRNRNQTFLARKRVEDIRKKASEEIDNLSNENLFLSGVMLYWAEGYKRPKIRNGRELTNHPVSLTNSDPYLVKLFLRFLRECCNVPENKIKAGIRIFQHHNKKVLQNFWQRETNILPQNFHKVYYGVSKSSMGKRPFNQFPYGVIQIIVADTNLFHRIMGYIEGFKKLV